MNIHLIETIDPPADAMVRTFYCHICNKAHMQTGKISRVWVDYQEGYATNAAEECYVAIQQDSIPPIVRRAMTETITDIGQLTPADKRTLNRYVKMGYLSKGKGGPYPMLKTVYACPAYDFAASRQAAIDEMMTIAKMEAK